jgi:hypothetical protein
VSGSGPPQDPPGPPDPPDQGADAEARGPLDFDAPPAEPPHPAAPDAPPPTRSASRDQAPRAKTPRRYGAFLALAAAALIVVVTLNTLGNEGPGSTGVPVGKLAPVFAAPLAAGRLQGDVNVATKPGQGAAGAIPACSVKAPGALVSCDLTRRNPAVLVFFVTAGSRCAQQLDAVERVRRQTPGVRYAAVAIRGDRGAAASLARTRGWRFPVGYDHDGVLANLYGVAVCPHITYILPGGRVDGTTVGSLNALGLRNRVAVLERHARAKGWRPAT